MTAVGGFFRHLYGPLNFGTGIFSKYSSPFLIAGKEGEQRFWKMLVFKFKGPYKLNKKFAYEQLIFVSALVWYSGSCV